MDLLVKFPLNTIVASPKLVASKSESNRALIINFLSGRRSKIENLSLSNDTRILDLALKSIEDKASIIDVADCGTAFRFLTALLSITPGEWILSGSERMRLRPVGIMVDALKQLGATIHYIGEVGFPPLKIVGHPLTGNRVSINTEQSSQFVSGLLLIAPTLAQGLILDYSGIMVSKPYIDMTIRMMTESGISIEEQDGGVTVLSGEYQTHRMIINGDWSSASYWYCIAAMAEECDLFLSGLKADGLQGDERACEMFAELGVKTEIREDGIRLTKQKIHEKEFVFHCAAYPDLVPALAVTLAANNLKGAITGIGNLKIKESDRISVITEQLNALGFCASHTQDEIHISKSDLKALNNVLVQTYNDHRIAMAFATLATRFGQIRIENGEVVAKSYPGFWGDLEQAGFVLE